MEVKRLIRRWLGYGDVTIIVYHAYEIYDCVYVRGRVLRKDNVISRPNDGSWRSFKNMWKRLMSDELPDVRVHMQIGDVDQILLANKEGFFEGSISVTEAPPSTCTLRIDQEALTLHQSTKVELSISIRSLSSEARYGIISDIDDTILVTGVSSRFKWRLILNTFFINPARRKTFPRTAQLFHRLVDDNNPVFYISNSPWNMYDYLVEYLQYQTFPMGILLLRDINFLLFKSKDLEKQSKYREIVKTMEAHQRLPFVLMGDAGEVDVDIYLRIAGLYPDRVKAIYIRSVQNHVRMARVREAVARVSEVEVVIFEHSNEVASHAVASGLILEDHHLS